LALSLFIYQYKGGKAMIANIQQSTSAAFYNAREKKVAKPSTYRERVIADRIVMALMLLATILFAAFTA